MKRLIRCEFNMDTACVELKYFDGSMLAIDCDAVEDEYAKTIRQRSSLDCLINNAPLEYADLVPCGDVEGYLKIEAWPEMIDGIERILADFYFS